MIVVHSLSQSQQNFVKGGGLSMRDHQWGEEEEVWVENKTSFWGGGGGGGGQFFTLYYNSPLWLHMFMLSSLYIFFNLMDGIVNEGSIYECNF